MDSRWRKIVHLCVVLMAGSGLLAVMIAFLGDVNWRADLFSHLRPQYCLWLALALLGGLFLRNRLAIGLAAVGLLANAVALAPFARPGPTGGEYSAVGRPLTFVTLNLLESNREVGLVTSYLRQTKADVVVLEEVSPFWAAELESMRDLYPYRSVQSRKDGFGIALLSRVEPKAVEFRVLEKRAGRFAVLASLEIDGHAFHLAGVHPDKPEARWKVEARQDYFSELERWCDEQRQKQEPVIVLGDFNATPWSSSMRALAQQSELRNANQGTIFGASWNVWEPHRLLIDHALLSPVWSLREHRIGPPVGSDHRPLMIKASLREIAR